MARGANCGGEGVAERGKGVGARRVGEGGWGEALNRSFEQNRYRYIEFGYRNAHYETKSAKNRDFRGDSPILEGIPIVMTSHSRKYVIISPKKTRKTRMREISLVCDCAMSSI